MNMRIPQGTALITGASSRIGAIHAARIVMRAEDMFDATLSGVAQGEAVTIPAARYAIGQPSVN